MCLKSSRSYSEDQMTRLAQLMASGKHQDRVGAVLGFYSTWLFDLNCFILNYQMLALLG